MQDETKGPETRQSYWRPFQVYVLAGVCLAIGFPVGYLLRGSAPEPPPVAAASAMPSMPPEGAMPTGMPPAGTMPGGNPHAGAMPNGMPAGTPTMADMKHMADKKAEPLLTELKSKPNDAKLLNQIGIVYRSAHQFSEAETYFQKSLAVDPKNADVRTDMAACMFYSGDADGAIGQLQQALKYDPKHPGALMNLGIIEWKAKNNMLDAVASWEKLLKLNPNFPQKDQIEHLIAEVKQSNKS